MKKRLLSVLLALVMVVSLLPMAVFADGGNVAKIGETEYATLQGAIDAAAEGATITLLQNIEQTSGLVIPAGKVITLDLAGKVLSGVSTTAGSSALITNNGKLTINDSSETKTGKITNQAENPDTEWIAGYPAYANNTITNRGALTVNGGTIESTTGTGFCIPIDNQSGSQDAILTVNGGYIVHRDGNDAVRQFANSTTYKNEVTIHGGTLEGSRAVWIQLPGSNQGQAPLATLTIDGGELISTDEDYNLSIYSYTFGNSREKVEINISDGIFDGGVYFGGGPGTATHENVTITGGHFQDVRSYKGGLEEFISGGSFGIPVVQKYLIPRLIYEACNDERYTYHDNAPAAAAAAGENGTVTPLPTDGSEEPSPLPIIRFYDELSTDAPSAICVENGSVTGWPADPTHAGYTFLGWYTRDGKKVTQADAATITESINLYAKWLPNAIIGGITNILTGAGSQMQHFVDVTSMDYYFDAVNWAYEHGITGGTGKVTFSPDAPCTRAQAVTFLWRAMGSPRAEKAATFTDVKADAYYADAVAWAVENGITKGTSATTFSPDAPCTRAQIVTLLYRAIGVESTVDAGFVDVPATAYYADAVNWATQYKITGGTGANRFSPDATCTRGQIVTFLYRAK